MEPFRDEVAPVEHHARDKLIDVQLAMARDTRIKLGEHAHGPRVLTDFVVVHNREEPVGVGVCCCDWYVVVIVVVVCEKWW